MIIGSDDAGAHSDSTVMPSPELIEIVSPERESPFTQDSFKNLCGIKPLAFAPVQPYHPSPSLGFAADAPFFSPGHPGKDCYKNILIQYNFTTTFTMYVSVYYKNQSRSNE